MKVPYKRIAFMLVVALAAVWPALHAHLVSRYDLNRWELFGWGMYTTPVLPGEVRLTIDERSIPRSAWPRWLVDELADFEARWRTWGRLASPRTLVRRIQAWQPQARRIRVRAIKLEMALPVAHVVAREDRYEWQAATERWQVTRHHHSDQLP